MPGDFFDTLGTPPAPMVPKTEPSGDFFDTLSATTPNPASNPPVSQPSGDFFDTLSAPKFLNPEERLKKKTDMKFNAGVKDIVDSAKTAPPQALRGVLQKEQKEAKKRGLTLEADKIGGAQFLLNNQLKEPQQALNAANVTKDPELIKQATENLNKNKTDEVIPDRGIVETAFDTVGFPNRLINSAIQHGGNQDLGKVWRNQQGGGDEFSAWIKKEHPNVDTAFRGTVGTIGDIIGKGTGAASEALSYYTGHGFDPTKIERYGKTGEDVATQFGENFLTDPLNVVGIGEANAGKKLGEQGLEMAAKSGLSKEAAVKLAKNLSEIAPDVLGKVDQEKWLKPILDLHGVKPEVAEKVLGAGTRYAGEDLLGKAALKLGIKQAPEIRSARQEIAKLRTGKKAAEEAFGAATHEAVKNKSIIDLSSEFAQQNTKDVTKEFNDYVKTNLPNASSNDVQGLRDIFDATFGTNKETQSKISKTLTSATKPLKSLLSTFRGVNLFGNPSYHAKNEMSDGMLMLSRGGPSVLFDAKHAEKMVLGGAKDSEKFAGGLTNGQAKDILQKAGAIGDSGAQSASRGGMLGNSLSEKAATVLSGGVSKLGQKFSGTTDEIKKMAMFRNRLRKGDSVENAITFMHDTLPDYLDPGREPKVLNAIKTFSPFAGWMYRIAPTAGSTAIRHPGSLSIPNNLADSLSAQADVKDELPSFMRERGKNVSLGSLPEFGQAMEAFTGEKPRGQFGYAARMPSPVSDAFQGVVDLKNQLPWTEDGSPSTIGNPILQGPIDVARGHDKFGKKVGIGRLLGDYVGPVPKMGWNELQRRIGKDNYLGNGLGNEPKDEAHKATENLLNMLSGAGLTKTMPGAQAEKVYEKANKRKVKNLKKLRKEKNSK